MNASGGKSLRAVAAAAVLFAVTASPGSGQVIAGPDGPVEFIGLQDWSAQELFDAIQATAPGQPFHACAVVMKEQLGFAEAAATGYYDVLSGDSYTVVVGVEDSTRVRRRAPGSESVALPETWRDLSTVAGEDIRVLRAAAGTRHLRAGVFNTVFNRARRRAARMGADPATVDELWNLIDSADTEEDRLLAHEVLTSESSWSARSIATLMLSNFMDEDTSWHGLVGSLVDPDYRVSSVARAMFDGLVAPEMDPVEWIGARAHLSALLDGTNPLVFREILQVLVATDVDPEFARQLVRETPDLLLAHVGAEHERTREPAVSFLRAISGKDHGTDVAAWTAWVNGNGQPD